MSRLHTLRDLRYAPIVLLFCLNSVTLSFQALVLNRFNLTVREGEVVALVGSSGGGKSSIMKLIKRVYEPKSGSILLDGRPISCYDNAWLQNNIAAVTQEPVLHDCRSSCPSICIFLLITHHVLLSVSCSLWRNIAFGALTEEEEREMREYDLAIHYPPIPRMKHRGIRAPESDDAIIDFESGAGDVRSAASINSAGAGAARDELQPLLGIVSPTRSGQQARLRQGLHTSNDNTSAIVKLSGIRAALMQE